MIVFDLKCGTGHVFESWFASSEAYAEQQQSGLIACPLCGDSSVEKAVMAPNIAAKGNRRENLPAAPKQEGEAPPPEAVKQALAMLAEAQKKALEKSQWVGTAFTDRARAMHSGEEAAAPIHGQATIEQARALIDEGVEVAPLPFPVVPPSARN
ncbi:DUF1178 family protein [Stakelama pacifica]|uniref:DUF1178 family protein n=1 Tax=Stakelama pacifica TaxID=517720 RepID=A0A4R6FRY4_9SPHN|nr:DUF1178 family protein [Stakelama pacifica]TDN84511.1 hypothetical protein EV664_103156 [Stakelama pacifica]GGO93595.1 hypothetical protein GCM10011329_13410 [Stakelama pacifica]